MTTAGQTKHRNGSNNGTIKSFRNRSCYLVATVQGLLEILMILDHIEYNRNSISRSVSSAATFLSVHLYLQRPTFTYNTLCVLHS